MRAKTLFSTALGIYEAEDFDGPPPFPFDEVVDKADYDALASLVREYLQHSSLDGKPIRQELRKQLHAITKSQD